jgi:two-component system sensor histidine kinase PrrB
VRMRPRSVRAQVMLSVAPLVMVLIALAGLTIVLRIDHRDRADVDRQMIERADRLSVDAGNLPSGVHRGTDPGVPDGAAAGSDGGLLAGSQSPA